MVIAAEQQADAPKGAQSDHHIDDSADNAGLSTTDPGHEVKLEKANQALSHHEWGFRQCLERGVPITFGTDSATPYNYHGKQGYEFELLQRFGMDPHKALVAATMTNAKVLGVDKTQGSVEKGKVADLCAWSCDPMEDVKTMQNCLFVMKEGKVVKS